MMKESTKIIFEAEKNSVLKDFDQEVKAMPWIQKFLLAGLIKLLRELLERLADEFLKKLENHKNLSL